MTVTSDYRVSIFGEQDAVMTDTRKRFRPLGNPPDTTTLWDSKVTQSMARGMPILESVLDEEFVKSRLAVTFPEGEDGEPVASIGNEVLEAMNALWKNCLIVKVLGKNIVIAPLTRKLMELWKPSGSMSIMDLPRQFYMVRFERENEYLVVLTEGPWKIFGNYIMVRRWSPDFDPLKDEITTTHVWIRLSNLPVNLYHQTILMGIASSFGHLIRVDETTLKFKLARFARVYVEVNLAKPVKGTIVINGDRYFVAYEGLMHICTRCGMYGHLGHACPRCQVANVVSKQAMVVEIVNRPYVVDATKITPDFSDDFTVVKRGGRKSNKSKNQVVSEAGGSDCETGAPLREIVSQSRSGFPVNMNCYAQLNEESLDSGLQKEAFSEDNNKENNMIWSKIGKVVKFTSGADGGNGDLMGKEKGT